MFPTNALRNSLGAAMVADTGSLGAVLAMNVHLILSPLVPAKTTDFTLLTEATFTGSTKLAAGAAPQLDGISPSSDALLLTLKAPAGGWRWECTVAPGSPETVVGYAVTDNADAVTLGSGLLAAPVTISAVGHVVQIPEITLTVPTPMGS